MIKPGAKRLGSELRDRRLQKGRTQQQLASEVGCDHTYISKIENGLIDPKQGPDEDIVRALANNLVMEGESADELFLRFMVYLDRLPEKIKTGIVEVIADGLRIPKDWLREKKASTLPSSLYGQIEKIVNREKIKNK